MSYVVGTESEAIEFTGDGAEYRPDGLVHAVDAKTVPNLGQTVLAYAVCGTAVRLWPDDPFDPDAERVHDRCAAITRDRQA